MNRARLTLIAAMAGLSAGAAQAQAQTVLPTVQALPVTGNAPQVCAIQQARLQPGGLVNIRGLDGDTLQIEELTDKRTLATRPSSATLSFAAVCNFPHRVRIESQNNGLWPTDGRMSSDADGFAYALPYHARLDWGPASGEFDADAKIRRLSEQRINVDVATADDLHLRIDIQAGASNVQANAPVLAGVYGDTLRIFLEPR